MTVSRIYHNREDRIDDIHEDKERVQYDKDDSLRITELSEIIDEYADHLFEALGSYVDSIEEPVDEDTESRVGYARREVIEKWALMQGAVSKVAWGLRFDGNQAYERMINAMKSGTAMDMRGL